MRGADIKATQNHGRNLTKPVSQKAQETACAYLHLGATA